MRKHRNESWKCSCPLPSLQLHFLSFLTFHRPACFSFALDKGDSVFCRDMTHTVEFFFILFYLENIMWWENFLAKKLIQDFPGHW